MDHKICWLASYPKSGNTWLRVFLTNYWQNGECPADINAIGGVIASDRLLFDRAMGIDAADLTAEEIDCYRPAVYRHIAARSESTLFMKVHDAWSRTATNAPLFPADATHGVIYVLRNPLDVAVSFAHHVDAAIDDVIARMADVSYSFDFKTCRLNIQLRQRLFTWSEHVKSWVDTSNLPVHVMRYEDMVCNPLETFAAVVRFAGLQDDPARICKAISFSRFDELQAQERQHGFKEGLLRGTTFFRQGQVNAWRQVLTSTQVARILRDHGEVMQRFGYLTHSGDVVE